MLNYQKFLEGILVRSYRLYPYTYTTAITSKNATHIRAYDPANESNSATQYWKVAVLWWVYHVGSSLSTSWTSQKRSCTCRQCGLHREAVARQPTTVYQSAANEPVNRRGSYSRRPLVLAPHLRWLIWCASSSDVGQISDLYRFLKFPTCPALVENSKPTRHAEAQSAAVSTGLVAVIRCESFSDVITPSSVPERECEQLTWRLSQYAVRVVPPYFGYEF